MESRYYQEEAKAAVNLSIKKNVKDIMIVMATGTGKTKTACDIIKDYGRTLWISHTEELIDQSAVALLLSQYIGDCKVLKKSMRQSMGLISYLEAVHTARTNMGIFQNPQFDGVDIEQLYNLIGIVKRERMDIHAKIVVASIQTINRRLDKIDPKQFDVIVVDECHYAMAKTWEKTINHFKYKLNLGLTATPHRTDGVSLGNIFDEIVYEYDILKGIQDKFLCELDAVQIKTNINLDSVKTLGGELNLGDLTIVNNPVRNKLIVEKYIEHASGRQFIAFCVDVKHAIDLCEEFNLQGIRTEFVVGDDKLCPDRKERIARYKNGETQGLINCMVLTTGFDAPDTGCIIMACPTKSLTKFLQCIGRGTRLKIKAIFKNCKILDIVDVTNKHALVNTWSLDRDKPIKEKIFKTEEQKVKMLFDLEKKRKAKIQKEDLHDNDIKVDLYKIPKVKVITSERMKEEATEKQTNWLARLGYDTVNVKYTKAQCSEIISQQPASPAQIYLLKKKGYDVHVGLTKAETQAAFNEIDIRENGVPKWKRDKYKDFV